MIIIIIIYQQTSFCFSFYVTMLPVSMLLWFNIFFANKTAAVVFYIMSKK